MIIEIQIASLAVGTVTISIEEVSTVMTELALEQSRNLENRCPVGGR